MEGVLLIVVLTFFFLLHVGADIPIQADFNIRKIAGKWYPMAVAVHNAATSPSDAVFQVAVPSGNGDLVLRNTVLKAGMCTTREMTLLHTDQPGKFLSPSKTSTLRMVDVNYDRYYILHVEMRYTAALHLYTRKQTGIAQEEKKFSEVAKSLGFEDYQISFRNKGGQTTMSMVEVDYGSYCILHFAAEDTNILHLFSREPQVSDEVKEKYMNHVTSMQFPEENIHYETRTGDCTE